jgi:hypothetical protein
MNGIVLMIDEDSKYEVDDLFEEAVDNVRSDRSKAHKYLMELEGITLGTFPDKYKMINKFVEASQRSNEQMIKITNMIYKNKRAGVEEDIESLGEDYYSSAPTDEEVVFAVDAKQDEED